MFDRLLFPTDGSEGAEAAFEHVLDLAAGHGATVDVLNVADVRRDSVAQISGEVVDALVQAGESVVVDAAERARERGVEVTTEVRQGRPFRVVLEYAAATDTDVIAMPTHGRTGLERFLLGSTTAKVVRQADVPVLTMQPDAELAYPYERVLVPTDGSDCADGAVAVGVDIAAAEGAMLDFVSVVNVVSTGLEGGGDRQVDAMAATAERILDEATELAAERGLEDVSTAVEFGTSIHRAILDAAAEVDADVIVVGTHGRTGVQRYVLGSVAEKLVRTAPVPVLTVGDPASEQ